MDLLDHLELPFFLQVGTADSATSSTAPTQVEIMQDGRQQPSAQTTLLQPHSLNLITRLI